MQRITVTNVAAEITYLRSPVFVLNNHNGARPKIAAKDRYALSLVPMISAKLDNTIFPKYQSILFWFFSCVNRTIETAKSAATSDRISIDVAKCGCVDCFLFIHHVYLKSQNIHLE